MISITVKVRSRGDLSALEEEVYEQAQRPLRERRYLGASDIEERYGASTQDLDAVEQVAARHDLLVSRRSPAERTVILSGKLGDVLSMFRANVALYRHAGGTYRGRKGDIEIPSELDGIVTGVFGLDNRGRHRRAPAGGPGPDTGRNPADFAERYNFPTSQNGATLDGTGQTVAIIELGGGFRMSDLQVYFSEIGQPAPSVTAVSVDHGQNSPTTPDSDDGEVMLDIEVVGAAAPGAKIVVYFSPQGNTDDNAFLDAIRAAVHDKSRSPSVISISWGGPESAADQQGIDDFHELFVAAAAQGITICAASGDHGVADNDVSRFDGKIHVDHPACDPMVLGCGGTQIEDDVDVAWNDGMPFDPHSRDGGGWSTGGGISTVFGVPTYQKGADLPDSLDTGKTGRGVPDIAMSATDYFVRVDRAEGASGGTSAVAPLMAALVARLNQGLDKRLGLMQPFLYANATTVMHDVTHGDNGIVGSLQGYPAGKGWDACTGLGTPDGEAILKALS